MKNIIILLFIILLFSGCESSVMPDPSTIIEYGLPEKSHVKLTIENSYHTVIAVIREDALEAGVYHFDFSADNLAEGVYFYTIEITGVTSGKVTTITHVMMLVKS